MSVFFCVFCNTFHLMRKIFKDASLHRCAHAARIAVNNKSSALSVQIRAAGFEEVMCF